VSTLADATDMVMGAAGAALAGRVTGSVRDALVLAVAGRALADATRAPTEEPDPEPLRSGSPPVMCDVIIVRSSGKKHGAHVPWLGARNPADTH
jgi:hypothetical protein